MERPVYCLRPASLRKGGFLIRSRTTDAEPVGRFYPMNTPQKNGLFRGGCGLLLVSLLCSFSTEARAIEPPAPTSSMFTGVFVGNTPASVGPHETWLGRPVEPVLLFTNRFSWKSWVGTTTFLKGLFGGSRRQHWSIPMFARNPDLTPGFSDWTVATSTQVGTRIDAEDASLSGSTAVVDSSFATHNWQAVFSDSAVEIGSTTGAVQFTVPTGMAAGAVRVSYRATVATSMSVSVNGGTPVTVTLAKTTQKDDTSKFDFQEIAIPGVTLAPGNTIRLSNAPGATFQVDYIAFGNYDEWYRRAALDLANLRPNDPVLFIRIGWEFNSGSYQWTPTGTNGPENYVTVFRRIVDIFRSVSPRYRFEWCPNFKAAGVDLEACYPGDGYIDVIGIDLYDSVPNFGYKGGPAARWHYYLIEDGGLDWVRDFAVKHGKLLALTEWGVGHGGDDNDLFVRKVQQWLADNRAIYHHYWDFDGRNSDDYDGSLRDGTPLNASQEYVFSFGTPVPMLSGLDAPPANSTDEFDKSVPRAQWSFLNPVTANWSLTAAHGRLRLTSDGSSFGAGGTASNVVLQRAPDNDFEMVTRVYGKPSATNQVAGLLVYVDSDHYLRMVRKRGNAGNVFIFGREIVDTLTDSSTADTVGSLAYLKIARVGTVYTGYYSDNGTTWTPVGTINTSNDANFATASIGFASYGTAGFAADFDTFHVNKLEVEYALLTAGLTGTDLSAASGERYVGSWTTNGTAAEWRNVPGGSQLVVRYAASQSGTMGLYIDGQRKQTIAFTATNTTPPSTSFTNLTVNYPIPAGSTLRLQRDSGDGPWNLDYVTLTYAAKFEAEEADTEDVTQRVGAVVFHAEDPTTPDDDWTEEKSSNEGALAIGPATWGAVKFVNLHAGTKVTLRYLWPEGGSVHVLVNGLTGQNVTLPAAASYQTHEITLPAAIAAINGSVKFSKSNAGRLTIDYIVVKP